jgi:hypothetical protein
MVLRPAIEKVREALERPRLLLPLDATMPASLSVRAEPVAVAQHLLECERRAGVLTTAATISALLDLTDRWVVQTRREPYRRRTTRAVALWLLQAELQAGRPLHEQDAQRWSGQLARVEPAEWEGVRAAFDDERVQAIEIVETARRGERLEAGVEVLGPNRVRIQYAYDGLLDRLGLYRDAVEALDRIEPAVIRQKDEAALRSVLRRRRGPHPLHPLIRDFNTYTDFVEHLTGARLARIAVQARLRVQDGGALPDDLGAFAGVLGSEALRDPLTREPFIWRRTDEGAVVMTPRAERGYVKFGTWWVR